MTLLVTDPQRMADRRRPWTTAQRAPRERGNTINGDEIAGALPSIREPAAVWSDIRRRTHIGAPWRVCQGSLSPPWTLKAGITNYLGDLHISVAKGALHDTYPIDTGRAQAFLHGHYPGDADRFDLQAARPMIGRSTV